MITARDIFGVVTRFDRADAHNALAVLRSILRKRRVAKVTKLPRPKHFDEEIRAYRAQLQTILDFVHARVREKLPHLDALERSRTDDWDDDVVDVFRNIRTLIVEARRLAHQAATSAAHRTNYKASANFRNTMKAALGVDVMADSPRTAKTVQLFIKENVDLIQSIPSRYLDEVQGIVLRNFRAGRRAEDFEDEIEDRYDVASSRASLIARDQIGKLNGQLTRDRHEALGIEAYFWRTSEDERVRDTHEAVDGDRFLWTDGPEFGHPGEDFNCRCHADPDTSAIFDVSEEDDQ